MRQTRLISTRSLRQAASGWHRVGFHYCNFGLNPRFEATLADAGLAVSGYAPDAGVEIVELPDHRFYFGTMFQPQMSPAADGREHPLLEAFLTAVGERVPA